MQPTSACHMILLGRDGLWQTRAIQAVPPSPLYSGKGCRLGPEVDHVTALWRDHLGVEVSWPDPWEPKGVHLCVTDWIPD
jgi:hypothetical protein